MTEPTDWAKECVKRDAVSKMRADADYMGVSIETVILMGILTEFQQARRVRPKEPWEDGSG